MTVPGDDGGRAVAIRERTRNVLVEASAGTGKTTFIVERILALVAPEDGTPGMPIDRIAAITFTRKAAGELRVRTRQRILAVLGELPAEAPRALALHRALAGIDTAELGTIHSFADRLLRRWPAQARLDPRYALDDQPARLVDECFELLIRAAETGTLAEVVHGVGLDARADEVTATLLELQRAGLRLRSYEGEHRTYQGLDGMIASLVKTRDVAIADIDAEDFDRASFTRYVDELARWTAELSTSSRGARWFIETTAILRRSLDHAEPALIYHDVVRRLEAGPRGRASVAPTLRYDFAGDRSAWDVWKAYDGDLRKRAVRSGSLREDLLAPLRRWLAYRLVRVRPVVLEVYERVKARHQAVDHVDLLLRLRDLLRDDRQVRREAQAVFDHILVDEFQDTDPLQAEVILYLCERGDPVATWTEVIPCAGTLTIVGDPKQSIYRFRRADIEAYAQVVALVARSPHVSARLVASWRSAPALVDWLNDRCAGILGDSYSALTHGRSTGGATTVHAVTLDLGHEGTADEQRRLEADAMARYVRGLVETRAVCVEDPITHERRAIRHGDVAVLAMSTTNLRLLFDAFERDRVPYAARGGTLFLSDPLHRMFLLGLAALADRDDGAAMAALLRPPFFATDLGDLARAGRDERDDRATQARAAVSELRRRRFERSVGATARALLDETALGRVIACGPNGSQRLTGVRELCLQLEALALEHQLDFDAAVEHVRAWITRPRQLERPHPVGADAVRVLTVHQAKGLEFPVVVLWDACATWEERGNASEAWMVARDGDAWAFELDGLRYEHPPGRQLAQQERRMREAERTRLVYVAATRARDVLVVPNFEPRDSATIFGKLLGEELTATVVRTHVHRPGAPAPWYVEASPTSSVMCGVAELDVQRRAEWEACSRVASTGILRPLAFTDAKSVRALWGRAGRYGTRFGSAVHQAIGLALEGASVAEAAARAAAAVGLERHLAEAAEDVGRALATLAMLGITAGAGNYRLEYPVAGVVGSGALAAGYVDIVADSGGPILLDFKTDLASADVIESYVEQISGYARVVSRGLDARALRVGLLFTYDGHVHWLSSGPDGEW